MRKLLHMIDCEIERCVEHEKCAGHLDATVQRNLHVLLENRKHLALWHKEREMAEAKTEHMNVDAG